MEKPLSCPFCSGAAKVVKPIYVKPGIEAPGIIQCNCGVEITAETAEEAIAAWNRRTLSKTETVEPVKDSYKLNEPLTLDELKQMDGEPLWVIEFSRGRWEIVFSEEEFLGSDSDTRFWYENYGTTWLAYRHKKEEGE